jgi:hypothetical protein
MNKDTSNKEENDGILDFYKDFDSLKSPIILSIEEADVFKNKKDED